MGRSVCQSMGRSMHAGLARHAKNIRMYVHASCHVIQVAMVVFWEILRVVYSKVETCAFRGIEMCLQLWYGGWGVSAQGELHGTQSVDRRRYLRYGSAD